jgi:hypothetical protein
LLLRRICIGLIILFVLSFAAAFAFLALHGRALVIAELERVAVRKVTLGKVNAVFPSKLMLEDLRIEGLASIPKAVIVADTKALLTGHLKIIFIEVDSPEVNINLSGLASVDAVNVPAVVTMAESVPNTVKQPVPALLRSAGDIDRIKVNGGVVMVQAPATGKTWIFQNVQADLRDFSLSRLGVKTEFVVSASLTKMNMPFIGHLARAQGWVNWPVRDMDSSVEVADEAGHVGFSAVVKAVANDCEVKGRVRLASSQRVQASGKKQKMIEATVLDLLGSLKSDIEANFSFRTPLDRIDVGKVSISGNITTGLQSEEISGNIVGSLKAAGAKFLDKEKDPAVKPYE